MCDMLSCKTDKHTNYSYEGGASSGESFQNEQSLIKTSKNPLQLQLPLVQK